MLRRALSGMLFLLFTALALPAVAQPALNPKDADGDFAFQGEYAGEIQDDGNSLKIGIQSSPSEEASFTLSDIPGDFPVMDGTEKTSTKQTAN